MAKEASISIVGLTKFNLLIAGLAVGGEIDVDVSVKETTGFKILGRWPKGYLRRLGLKIESCCALNREAGMWAFTGLVCSYETSGFWWRGYTYIEGSVDLRRSRGFATITVKE